MSLTATQYVHEVLGQLYPHSPSGAPKTYLVVPYARGPKLLVPLGSRRVAAAAVRQCARQPGTMARLRHDAVALALRCGALPALLRDRVRLHAGDSIDSYLKAALGTELSLSIHIGPAREGRKPLLRLLSPAGETLGFAKLGTCPLTRELVEAETAALTGLSQVALDGVAVPSVLHSGQWRGYQVLVESPLPLWLPRVPVTVSRLSKAMREIASARGVTQGWLATSPYWAGLQARLGRTGGSALAGRDLGGSALGGAAQRLVERCHDLGLRYGAWHGNWVPSNMANTERGLLVWSWERFAAGVPLGFDALHHALQERLRSGADPRAAAEQTVNQAAGLLTAFEVMPGTAEITALLYLIEVAARDLSGRHALGPRLVPVIAEGVGRL
jgi:hypothetical protein